MDEKEYAAARARMVREQLQAQGITDARVLNAMERVPRHRFMPPELRETAYEDKAQPIGLEQTISQPLMVAIMAQMLKLKGAEHILEVGAGSGYGAAVLGELGRDVVTMERHPELADRARNMLREQGYENVAVVVGDGSEGHAAGAPYDRILVAAASPRVPQSLVAQLAPGGRLILPVGTESVQTLTVVTKDAEGNAFRHEHGACSFVPLIGAEGWSPED